jgi:tRNA (cytosine34-C5)-methyltransferase
MQLLEFASSGGLVVANDIHPGRVSALRDAIVGRSGLLPSTLSRLVIGCHDGSKFPKPKGGGFDKVLTDVPCSGDGTIRKDGSILPRWNPSISNGLHAIQVEIGWRGLELLKVGGVMAYSTCTFNPIEDEAVVQELVRRGGGAVEIIDWPSDVLPGLKKRAGRVKWRVADHVEGSSDNDDDEVKIRWHDDGFETARRSGMAGVVRSLWPLDGGGNEKFGLEKCCRFLPQDQNTGGFFVALLRKERKKRRRLWGRRRGARRPSSP